QTPRLSCSPRPLVSPVLLPSVLCIPLWRLAGSSGSESTSSPWGTVSSLFPHRTSPSSSSSSSSTTASSSYSHSSAFLITSHFNVAINCSPNQELTCGHHI